MHSGFLLQLQLRLIDHRFPACELDADLLAELRGRIARRKRARFLQLCRRDRGVYSLRNSLRVAPAYWYQAPWVPGTVGTGHRATRLDAPWAVL